MNPLDSESDKISIASPDQADPLKKGQMDNNQEDIIELSPESQIFNYLVKQHDRLLRHNDAIDMKIAQGLAFNGVILSFIFDKLYNANLEWLFALGLALIVLSMTIGIYIYSGRLFSDSPRPEFYEECNDQNELQKALIKDIRGNDEILKFKAYWFNKMLILNVLGIILIIVGYYGG